MEFPQSQTFLPQTTNSAIANAIPIWKLLNMSEEDYYKKYHNAVNNQEDK